MLEALRSSFFSNFHARAGVGWNGGQLKLTEQSIHGLLRIQMRPEQLQTEPPANGNGSQHPSSLLTSTTNGIPSCAKLGTPLGKKEVRRLWIDPLHSLPALLDRVSVSAHTAEVGPCRALIYALWVWFNEGVDLMLHQ